ncbi:uncharacterized protein (DUF305 family) [Nonomuraea polychroma]|uniref:Uncharacterized protein (DUF305 family) n=2 Tax=Nonomuraea polychroma TaxID=46176 RepID=A0A438MGT6_9ACTN|nr:uncharacterized protein (DUF305 family) [Nonomuraea polychroma]
MAAAVLAGCAQQGQTFDAAPPSVAAGFSATDVAWLQLADALHTRALPLLALARERSGDRSLADLAVRLADKHETVRGRLRALLLRAGMRGENPHVQHDMPGMPTSDDLEALEGMRGDVFDRRFAALLRAYLDQLVLVADGERRSGGAAEVRELAAAMGRAHAAELAELDRSVGWAHGDR